MDEQPQGIDLTVDQPRRAGILLHPTSLPGSTRLGTLGEQAHRFIDLLADSGVSLWQMLPLGPVHEDLSPYMSLSAHAGNPLLIDIDWIQAQGWLQTSDISDGFYTHVKQVRDAFPGFMAVADEHEQHDYALFCSRHAHWLDDYALYMALHEHFEHRSWTAWPSALRDRQAPALESMQQSLSREIEAIRFEQYLFYRQWQEIKAHAKDRGLLLVGDMPIFVAHDSADVWTARQNFNLDAEGMPLTVAGVPPDYFSATGQRWGNPHFDWNYMQQDNFSWWIERVKSNLELFDIVRVDHFRGFEACWQIPAEAETAVEGFWQQVPGEDLFDRLLEVFGRLPFIAEDLGIITPQVEALRDRYHLPGMKILQFAFGGYGDNPYLPANYSRHCVVYTGTHDNDTTLGWYQSLDESQRQTVLQYIDNDRDMPWPVIELCFSSRAETAIVPMQDILMLATDARMNIPGQTEGNWRWRFGWEQLSEDVLSRLALLIARTER